MTKRFSFFCLFFFTSVLCQWSNTFAESDPKNSIGNSFYGTIQLNEEEENWIEQKHVVRARVGENPPLHFYDGQNRGICVEYLDLIAEVVGFQVEYVHGIPWTDALENIKKQDTVDLLLTAKNVKERRPYMRFSDDYLFMPWVIVSRTDSDFISSIDDLTGKTVAVEKGYVMQSRLMAEFPSINLLVKNSTMEALQAVASSEADAYIGNLAISTYIINKHNLTNLKVASPAPFDNHNQAFVVRNDWPELVSILNKAIIATSASELPRLRNKWFNVQFEYGLSKTVFFKWITIVIGICSLILIFFATWTFSLRVQIAKRKKAEEDLRESKEKLRLIIDTSPIGICTVDSLGDFITTNSAYEKVLGYTKEELKGLSFYDVTHPDNRPKNKELFQKMFDMDSVGFHMEKVYIKKDGSSINVNVHATAVKGNGNIRFGTAFVEDITEIKQAEAEKEKLEKQLQQSQKMEAIGTLAGGIAHDFNNILSAILGYSQFVKEDLPDGSPANKDIDMVIQSSIRATELVKQILTFSRKTEHQRQPLTPHLIIKEVLQMLRSTLPSTIEIKQDIDKECGKIEADPTNIHQITVNLCFNALHAMESQKGTLTIKLFREDLEDEDVEAYENVVAGSFVVLSVSDTGHGMDTKTMKRVFEPYFTTKEIGEGSGLGLAVIHGIVQDCKGFVRVVSNPDQGSTFSVYFPLLEESMIDKDDYVTPQKNEVALPQGRGRIIVVDDEELLVRVNKRRLESAGYTVTVTTNSEEALEKIRAHPEQFDLLITDQTMPKMSGVELTREVHKIKPDMPVIMSTGHSDLVTKEEALKMGISKYVVKPIQGSELIDAVGEVLCKK